MYLRGRDVFWYGVPRIELVMPFDSSVGYSGQFCVPIFVWTCIIVFHIHNTKP